jgi:6-phosphogluconolactonase
MTSKNNIRIFPTPFELAESFAADISGMISSASPDKPFTIALAGGSTPELMYNVLGDHYANEVNWDKSVFFWGDERCVPPGNPESNYGMAFRALIRKINISSKNVHRIMGENDPIKEAVRYSDDITANTQNRNGLPWFDLVLLGLGDDGHTASIFPGMTHLISSTEICEVTHHPSSGQRRITITGNVLNNSSIVAFLVTGEKKADVVRLILNNETGSEKLPASLIAPSNGKVIWLLDNSAAAGIRLG